MENYTPVPLAFTTVDPEGTAVDKPPVIFAHGLTASKEHWADIPQIVANATKRKVYAIDARNHGDSEWSDVFNFDVNVTDILHFMDSIGARKATIVGHSMGGVTGIKAALTAPERIEKLIVEDMVVRKLPPQIYEMVKMFVLLSKNAIQQVPADVDEETAKKMIIEFIIKQVPPEAKHLVKLETVEDVPIQLKRTQDGRYSFKANVDVLEKALINASEMMTENTGVFDGPASFIYGKQSPFLVGLDEPNVKQHFPNAELVGIDNATHSVHTDCPKEFTEAVLNFLLRE